MSRRPAEVRRSWAVGVGLVEVMMAITWWTMVPGNDARAQDGSGVVITVRPMSAEVAVGQPWRATVYFLNAGADAVRYVVPDRIPWSGVGEAAGESGVWWREAGGSSSGTGPVELPGGGFVQATYATQLPGVWAGAGDRVVVVPQAGGLRLGVSMSRITWAGGGGMERPDTWREGVGAMPDLSPVGPRELPGQGFFRRHFAGYEPVYFVWGPEAPNAKFQVSFRYRMWNPEAVLDRWWSWARGVHIAYTQTTLWDLNQPSAPFYDTSYKPELMWRDDDVFPGAVSWWRQLGLQAGLQHESNGKDGVDSRSLNIVYLRPTLVWGEVTNLFLAASPRFWVYAGDLSGNPDINDYRGNADLTIKGGWARGVQAAGLFRVGQGFDHGSMQIDITFPILQMLSDVDLLLHAQYFNGWGESLLDYDERTWLFRVGVSLFR
ncbi:MAG: phospholipase A [Verrucomicrobiales bacterium]|nr:phospholipase A [Verrucomicrobiales bacterium]